LLLLLLLWLLLLLLLLLHKAQARLTLVVGVVVVIVPTTVQKMSRAATLDGTVVLSFLCPFVMGLQPTLLGQLFEMSHNSKASGSTYQQSSALPFSSRIAYLRKQQQCVEIRIIDAKLLFLTMWYLILHWRLRAGHAHYVCAVLCHSIDSLCTACIAGIPTLSEYMATVRSYQPCASSWS
jgi:hypothetical protein